MLAIANAVLPVGRTLTAKSLLLLSDRSLCTFAPLLSACLNYTVKLKMDSEPKTQGTGVFQGETKVERELTGGEAKVKQRRGRR